MYRGMAYPFRIENGSSNSSSDKERILESIEQILLTSKGERVGERLFGSSGMKLVFSVEAQRPIILLDIKNQIEELDDRISDVTLTTTEEDGTLSINVAYTFNEERSNETFTVIK